MSSSLGGCRSIRAVPNRFRLGPDLPLSSFNYFAFGGMFHSMAAASFRQGSGAGSVGQSVWQSQLLILMIVLRGAASLREIFCQASHV